MKVEEKSFDFKFLNFLMYFGFAVAIYFLLKNLGWMDKIVQSIAALLPVFLGIVICWVTMPLTNWLRKLGINKTIAAFISLIIIFGVIIFVFAMIVPIFASQFSSLVKEFPNIYNDIIDKINPVLIEKFNFQNGIEHFQDLMNNNIIKDNIPNIVNYSISTLQSVVSMIITLATTIIISFFMVKDIDRFKTGIFRFFSHNKDGSRRYKMLMEIDQSVMSYVKGTVIDSVIVGILTTIACMILGLDYAIVFGILITVLNFIPYIGAILSEVIVALYALTVGGPVYALITFASLLLVQLIDANILQPNIIGRSVNLHPVIVLGGLIVFQLLFGIVGMIIAMPILAIIKIILEYKFSMQFDEVFTEEEMASGKKMVKQKIKIESREDRSKEKIVEKKEEKMTKK